MRTKALLCAAFVAAGALVAVAQNNVYSLNIVGYVNVPVSGGYNLLANPLSAGVTNGANEIMSPTPSMQFLTWNGAGYNVAAWEPDFGGWVDLDFVPVAGPQLPPGKGFFLLNPGTAMTVTFVGQVVPGPGVTNALSLPGGYSLIGSPLPATVTDIAAAPVALPQKVSSQVLQWTGAGYRTSVWEPDFGGWVDLDFVPVATPSYTVGTGFFFLNPDSTPVVWNQSLPTQP